MAEYFADKWQEEVDLYRSDATADAVTRARGGVRVFVRREAQDEPSFYDKYNAGARALEKLRERGFKVELDAASVYPDVYRVWKE